MNTVNFVLLILVALSFGITWYLNQRIRNIRKYELAFTNFFECAEPVIGSKDAPSEVVDLLRMIEFAMRQPAAARYFFFAQLAFEENGGEPSTDFKDLKKALDNFEDDYEDLTRSFMEASAHGLMAVSYNGGLFGWFLRLKIFSFMHKDREIAPTIAASIKTSLTKGSFDSNNHAHNCVG